MRNMTLILHDNQNSKRLAEDNISEELEQGYGLISSAIDQRKVTETIGKLNTYCDTKDLEIRKVCSTHYEEFINSVQEAIKMKENAVKLQNGIVNLRKESHVVLSETLKKMEALSSQRKIIKNIDLAAIKIQQCHQLISLAVRVENNIKSGKYYHALRILEELRHDLPASQNQQLAQVLNVWIPQRKEEIKEKSQQAVTEWLVEMREQSKTIGKKAVDRWKKEENINELDYKDSMIEMINPLLQSLHIFVYLESLGEFENFYKTNRLPQIDLQKLMNSDMYTMPAIVFAAQHETFFHRFVGFFVVESYILQHSNSYLLSNSQTEQLWTFTCRNLFVLLQRVFKDLKEVSPALSIKKTALCCAFTLEKAWIGYKSQPIVEFLRSMRECFIHIVEKNAVSIFGTLWEQKGFEPLVASNKKEYDKIVQILDRTMEEEKNPSLQFPYTFPCSKFVVESCHRILDIMHMYLEFCDNLNIPDNVENACDLLTHCFKVVNDLSIEFMDQSQSLQISQTVQIAINATYLGQACEHMAKVVKSLTAKSSDCLQTIPIRKLESKASFKAAKWFEQTTTRAQDLVCELTVAKIDDLLSAFTFVDWCPSMISQGPHAAVVDLIDYLQVTFTYLGVLPAPVRESVHFSSCSHIRIMLTSLVCGPRVSKINSFGIYNMKQDLNALAEFADGCHVPQLRECFASMEQLLNFLLSSDIKAYMDSNRRQQTFPQLQLSNVQSILKKYVEINPQGSIKCPISIMTKKAATEFLKNLTT